jgi:hypothetical protein
MGSITSRAQYGRILHDQAQAGPELVLSGESFTSGWRPLMGTVQLARPLGDLPVTPPPGDTPDDKDTARPIDPSEIGSVEGVS